jgi:hypothetical protein
VRALVSLLLPLDQNARPLGDVREVDKAAVAIVVSCGHGGRLVVTGERATRPRQQARGRVYSATRKLKECGEGRLFLPAHGVCDSVPCFCPIWNAKPVPFSCSTSAFVPRFRAAFSPGAMRVPPDTKLRQPAMLHARHHTHRTVPGTGIGLSHGPVQPAPSLIGLCIARPAESPVSGCGWRSYDLSSHQRAP